MAFELALSALHQRRLFLAGHAPGGEEVQDHDLAAIRVERALATAGERRQRLGGIGCHRMLAMGEVFVEAAVGGLVAHAVDQQPDQGGARDGDEGCGHGQFHGAVKVSARPRCFAMVPGMDPRLSEPYIPSWMPEGPGSRARSAGDGQPPCACVSPPGAAYLRALLALGRERARPTQAALARSMEVSAPTALE